MKKVIFISGTMGSGKSTVSRLCSEQLTRSVWLDGDWCWMMHPFQVNDQTKAMVLNNITYLLNQFLAQPDFDYILFSWVMDDPNRAFDFKPASRRIYFLSFYLIAFPCSAAPPAAV